MSRSVAVAQHTKIRQIKPVETKQSESHAVFWEASPKGDTRPWMVLRAAQQGMLKEQLGEAYKEYAVQKCRIKVGNKKTSSVRNAGMIAGVALNCLTEARRVLGREHREKLDVAFRPFISIIERDMPNRSAREVISAQAQIMKAAAAAMGLTLEEFRTKFGTIETLTTSEE